MASIPAPFRFLRLPASLAIAWAAGVPAHAAPPEITRVTTSSEDGVYVTFVLPSGATEYRLYENRGSRRMPNSVRYLKPVASGPYQPGMTRAQTIGPLDAIDCNRADSRDDPDRLPPDYVYHYKVAAFGQVPASGLHPMGESSVSAGGHTLCGDYAVRIENKTALPVAVVGGSERSFRFGIDRVNEARAGIPLSPMLDWKERETTYRVKLPLAFTDITVVSDAQAKRSAVSEHRCERKANTAQHKRWLCTVPRGGKGSAKVTFTAPTAPGQYPVVVERGPTKVPDGVQANDSDSIVFVVPGPGGQVIPRRQTVN